MQIAARLQPVIFIVLTLVLLLAVVLSLMLGAVSIAPGESLKVLLNLVWPQDVPADSRMIIEQIRLPRTLTGLLIGATLALTGAVMQGLFRNPLADPGLIGVSSGAAFGAAVAIALSSLVLARLPEAIVPWVTVLGAFAGGVVTTWLVYRLGQTAQGTSVASMLLAGVAIAAISGAAIGLLGYLADDLILRTLTFWNMGSLASAGYTRLGVLTLCCALVWWRLLQQMDVLNALLLGESEARHLGVNVERVKRELIALTALGVGACVASAGLIGFVGLVVPHLIRLLLGADNRHVLPASMLLGGALLLLADVAARLLLAPAEMPLGILTALIGGPFFIGLLIRARGRGEL